MYWLVCSFYLNFKIIIKRSGLIAHSLSIVVEIVATCWLRHLTDLGVAWQAYTTWSGPWQPCIVPSLHCFYYFTAVHTVPSDHFFHFFASIVVPRRNKFLDKVGPHHQLRGNVQKERAGHTMLSYFVSFFVFFLSCFKHKKIAGRSTFFARLKAHPIGFELCCQLCCLNYIFQALKIYIIRKKKRWVSVHKTTNAQTSEIRHLIWLKT